MCIRDRDDHEDECINCSQDIDWKFIANVRKNIEDNIDNPALTVDVLCNLMGMSRTSFYNKLRALTDQAPGDYIRLIRLKRSVKLLKEGTHSITAVSYTHLDVYKRQVLGNVFLFKLSGYLIHKFSS